MSKALYIILAWFIITLFISGGLMFVLTFISMFSDAIDPKYPGILFVSSLISLIFIVSGDIEITIKN